MTYRRALLAGFCTALLFGLAWGCAAADSTGGTNFGTGGAQGIPDGGNDELALSVAGATSDQDGGIVLNVLCGRNPTCTPDSPPNSCSRYAPPVVPSGDASPSDEAGSTDDAGEPSGEGQSSQAGASAEGGAGGASGAGGMSSMTDGGAVGAAGTVGASGAGAVTGAGAGGESGEAGGAGAPPVEPAKYGCQVQRIADAPTHVTSQCAVVGSGGENAPCFTSSDCQVGFGCVGDQDSGLCQAYCCESADNCKQGKYCAARSMRDALINTLPRGSTDVTHTLNIPVCVPAENCDLGAPYPCTDGTQCACAAGTACLVVRSDGTTTCATPGKGELGDACPCAWGYVCSAATNQCLQLCYTRGAPSCGDGKCQSASQLPDGWGVCVGATPSSD